MAVLDTERAPHSVLVVATSGVGGDLQPLMTIAAGLRDRGHAVVAFGDALTVAAMADLGVETLTAEPEHDLASQYAASEREGAHLSPEARGEDMRQRLFGWAERLAPAIGDVVESYKPQVVVTSAFGSAAVHVAASGHGLPWVGVNSTFYLGPRPPRSPELDFGPRAPVFRDYLAPNLNRASLVLHASDREFDFGFNGLPAHHRYVGPLFWTPPAPPLACLEQPGNPWVLVTLSSHTQDDLPIARTAVNALGELPVRVLATIGEHAPEALDPLPPNVLVTQYVAHGPVLECAALMVSHAGHGSVMRALWSGVPMVLIPWGRDQRGVALRAEQLGVAKVIPRNELTADRLASTARRLLDDRAVNDRAAAISERLQKHDPVHLACSLIEGTARTGAPRGVTERSSRQAP